MSKIHFVISNFVINHIEVYNLKIVTQKKSAPSNANNLPSIVYIKNLESSKEFINSELATTILHLYGYCNSHYISVPASHEPMDSNNTCNVFKIQKNDKLITASAHHTSPTSFLTEFEDPNAIVKDM